MKTSWLSLGRVAQKMIDTQAFEQLGFRSMRAWMESRLGEQMASAYHSLRAVRALEGVPESKLEKIGTGNAQVLVRLPAKERRSDEWLTKAATLPEKQLRTEVDALIEKKTGMPKEKLHFFFKLLNRHLVHLFDGDDGIFLAILDEDDAAARLQRLADFGHDFKRIG